MEQGTPGLPSIVTFSETGTGAPLPLELHPNQHDSDRHPVGRYLQAGELKQELWLPDQNVRLGKERKPSAEPVEGQQMGAPYSQPFVDPLADKPLGSGPGGMDPGGASIDSCAQPEREEGAIRLTEAEARNRAVLMAALPPPLRRTVAQVGKTARRPTDHPRGR